MELTFAAATDVGRQREHNEDNFLIDKRLRLFLVADGMGGHAAGEVASSIAVHEIRDAIYRSRDVIDRYRVDQSEVGSAELLQILEHAIQAASSSVYSRAQADGAKRGMGTTATVLLIAGSPDHLRGFIAHVGDSRVYLTRQDHCHVLTEDHSLVNELVRRGKLDRAQIDSSPYKQFKNAVTRAVGVYATVEVDTFDFDILPGDSFLLCSDGLHAYIDEATLVPMLSGGDVKDAPAKLIALANQGGGHDNITGVVVRVGVADQEPQHVGEVSLKLEVLKGMRLFRYLSYKELVVFSNIAEIVEIPADTPIFSKGQPGDTMYVVLRGAVKLARDGATVARLERGQHFGEMSIIDRSVRSLSATTSEATQLVAIHRSDFYELIRKESQLSVKLLWSFVQVLGERLRKTNSDLADALAGEKHGADTTAENLFQD